MPVNDTNYSSNLSASTVNFERQKCDTVGRQTATVREFSCLLLFDGVGANMQLYLVLRRHKSFSKRGLVSVDGVVNIEPESAGYRDLDALGCSQHLGRRLAGRTSRRFLVQDAGSLSWLCLCFRGMFRVGDLVQRLLLLCMKLNHIPVLHTCIGRTKRGTDPSRLSRTCAKSHSDCCVK